jgi:hypothetical protein
MSLTHSQKRRRKKQIELETASNVNVCTKSFFSLYDLICFYRSFGPLVVFTEDLEYLYDIEFSFKLGRRENFVNLSYKNDTHHFSCKTKIHVFLLAYEKHIFLIKFL